MDRNILQYILLAVVVFGLFMFFNGKGCSSSKGPNWAVVSETHTPMPQTSASVSGTCTLQTNEFSADVAPVGGGLLSYSLKNPRYQHKVCGKSVALDLAANMGGFVVDCSAPPAVRTPDYAPLRTTFRTTPKQSQVTGDFVEYSAQQVTPTECLLSHHSEGLVDISRKLRAGEKPYEISVETTITNRAVDARKHQAQVGVFGVQFKSLEGSTFSRPAEGNLLGAVCASKGTTDRKDKGSLRDWFVSKPDDPVDYVAISNAYFAQTIMPLDGRPHCAMVAQDRGTEVEPEQASLFYSYLTYPEKELNPGESATYRELAFLGPKDPALLAHASRPGLDRLINLGTFSFIAIVLVWILATIKGVVGSWGVAIIVLTIVVRMLLMPLMLPQIRQSVKMRRLKPEVDALNAKYADNMQAKGEAMQKLYRDNGINPLTGCLPALLQMPVWWALYQTLSTSIELYHRPFLLLADLSAPDPLFILPILLGGTMFLQQRLTPMQGDPSQQRIFQFMPLIFTVFMLFLPAGLGVYMLTNTVLGMIQMVLVEQQMKRQLAPQATVRVVEKENAKI